MLFPSILINRKHCACSLIYLFLKRQSHQCYDDNVPHYNNFEITQDLHEHIIILLYGISDFILHKENELNIHKKKTRDRIEY